VASAELVAAIGSLAVSLPILFRTLQVSVRSYLASLWRPLAASCLMGWAVHASAQASRGSGGLGGAVLELLVAVPVGAVVYPLTVVALWMLSGRPESVEAIVLRKLRDLLPGAAHRSA
jgi:hypothetical protein